MLLKDKNPQFYENLCQLYPKNKEQLDNLNAPKFEVGQKAILNYFYSAEFEDGKYCQKEVLIMGYILLIDHFTWQYSYAMNPLYVSECNECHLELNYMCLGTGVVDESD